MDDSSSNIDQQLLNAYRKTIYRVESWSLDIQIGVANPTLDTFLQKQDAQSWAFITAWNPRSTLLPLLENGKRHQRLMEMVRQAGYTFFLGQGIVLDANWEPECSLFIINIIEKEAITLGKYFDQNAIVFGYQNEVPQLLITVD